MSPALEDLPGVAPIRDLLADASVSEIMINGLNQVYIERGGRMMPAPVLFRSEQEIRHLIDNLLIGTGRSVTAADPCVDVALSNGFRVNIAVPPIALDGPNITIRKFSESIDDVDVLLKLGTLDERMARVLVECVRGGADLLFTGATGTGKTTTLDILSGHIPEDERIIVIEDTAELRLTQPHVVRLQARMANTQGAGAVTLRMLFRNSLRMRPDRILIGEVRGEEAVDMVQAIASGHHGCMGVVHASSPSNAIRRLEVMMLQGGLQLPLWAIHRQIAETIELIVQHEQMVDGSRKITHVSAVQGAEEDGVRIEDVFTFVPEADGGAGRWIRRTGAVPACLERIRRSGARLSAADFAAEGS